MTVTVWRIPTLMRHYSEFKTPKGKKDAAWHRRVVLTFKEWLIDIPYIPLFVLALPFIWRSPFMIKEMWKVPYPRIRKETYH